VKRWLIALFTLLFGRVLRRYSPPEGDGERIVPAGPPERGAENLVLVLLGISALWAVGFVVTYAEFSPRNLPTELLGVCLGFCLLFGAAALIVVSKQLVVEEEIEEDYPLQAPEAQSDVAQIVHESGSRFTRKRLLLGAGGLAGGALGAALLTPLVSWGPLWDTTALDQTTWRRGKRLVDEDDRPYTAAAIEEGTFYTAFPEGADKEELSSPVVVVRLDPSVIRLPRGRESWAPLGILAYSKICTHAGCAVALYRKPTFATVDPIPALVCPCHYSTFNPATGASVVFGPAGRPLPQLPLLVDESGYLRAAGNYSQRVGPSWGEVRKAPQ
jgi:ubiquinol-cytochrome c reductase iron-sulfur subunit